MFALLGCLLLFAVASVYGQLDFRITRYPGNDICAHLICTRGNTLAGSEFEPRRITLFEVTQSGQKNKLATVSKTDSNLIIDPSRAKTINGSGVVSADKTELDLSLRDPSDCLYATLLCQIELVTAKGKVQNEVRSLGTTSQSTDLDCTCASVKAQFSVLRFRSDGTIAKLSSLNLSHANLREAQYNNKNDSQKIEEDIARVAHSNDVKSEQLIALQQRSVEIDNGLDFLRRNETRLGQSVIELTRQDQALNEDVNLLKKSDNAIGKQIYDTKRNDKLQREYVNTLTAKDDIIREDLAQISQTFNDISDDINKIENDTKAIKVAVDQQTQNDEARKNKIKNLRDRDAEIQQDLNKRVQIDHDAAQRLGILTDVHEDIENDVAVLNQRDVAISGDIAQLAQSNTQQQDELSAIAHAHAVYRKKIDSIRASDEAINAHSVNLNRNDTAMSQRLSELESQFVSQERILVSISTRVTVRELEITSEKIRIRVIEGQVDRQSLRSAALEKEVASIRTQNLEVEAQIQKLLLQISAIQAIVNARQVTTVTKTTTSLVLTSCTRGVVSDNKQAQFLLYGTIPALCDTATDGGGWVVIQRRGRGDVDFFRGWNEYKKGFGNTQTDYWLGLENIRNLTSQGYTELYVDIIFQGKSYYASYSNFRVASESTNYKLTVTGYKGTAGDDLSYHNGMAFSTFDKDNDMSPDNCAQTRGGANWYNACYRVNQNGRWGKDDKDGIIVKGLSEGKAVSFIEFKVRLVRDYRG